MSFANVRLETGYIIYNTDGGATFSTDIVVVNSGFEQRNQVWLYAGGLWDFGDRKLPDSELTEIINFFRARAGMAEGFLFKDWGDYQADITNGIIGATGHGTGLPTYQLTKTYSSGGSVNPRLIQKPVSGTFTGYRNASPITVGGAAGNITIDYTTGIVTFVADASASVASVTPGTSTVFTITATNLGLSNGQKVYLSGFAGTDAALLNGIAHSITNITGAGPYTFTISTDTAGKTITVGAAVAAKYPQTTDVLTFASEFDVPVRFDTDHLKYRFDSAETPAHGTLGRKFFYLSPLPITEIRV